MRRGRSVVKPAGTANRHSVVSSRFATATGTVLLAVGLIGAGMVACATAPDPQADPRAPRRKPLDPTATVTRIAFGSCNRADLPQPLWAPILSTRPDLWIWLGDNVYADSTRAADLRAEYARQIDNPGYRALMAGVAVIGTWDDHDYGANDAGAEYPTRVASQQALLDFLGEPANSPRRRQEGVYTSYTLGTPPRQAKVILLDARYHREPPGLENDTLGDEQWAWLERELRDSDASLHLIGSGYQFLPQDHNYEKWANFPAARERLLQTIADSRAPGVVLLSGDRHMAELSRVAEPPLSYPLYELTSSGLTHSWDDNPGETNRHRVGELYTDLNFGVIEIDWDRPTPLVRLQIRNGDADVVIEELVSLADLESDR